MGVVKRIKEYIDLKGITNQKFEKQIGYSNGAFATQVKNNKTIGSDKLENILKTYTDINPEWLLTGSGKMLRSEYAENFIVMEPQESYHVKRSGYPLLSMEAFAGNGDENILGEELARITERYEIPLFRGLHVDFMISVKGSSMYPKYNSGDVVACRIINEILFIQWNKVYVIDTITQGVILKRLKPSENTNMVICKSDNKDYDEFELPKSEIRRIAMVVGVVRLE